MDKYRNKALHLLLLLLPMFVDQRTLGESGTSQKVSGPSSPLSADVEVTAASQTTPFNPSVESLPLTKKIGKENRNNINSPTVMDQPASDPLGPTVAALSILNKKWKRSIRDNENMNRSESDYPHATLSASSSRSGVESVTSSFSGTMSESSSTRSVVNSAGTGFVDNSSLGEKQRENDRNWDHETANKVPSGGNSIRKRWSESTLAPSVLFNNNISFSGGDDLDFQGKDSGRGNPEEDIPRTDENSLFPDYQWNITGGKNDSDLHVKPTYPLPRPTAMSISTDSNTDSWQEVVSTLRAHCQQEKQQANQEPRCEGREWDSVKAVRVCYPEGREWDSVKAVRVCYPEGREWDSVKAVRVCYPEGREWDSVKAVRVCYPEGREWDSVKAVRVCYPEGREWDSVKAVRVCYPEGREWDSVKAVRVCYPEGREWDSVKAVRVCYPGACGMCSCHKDCQDYGDCCLQKILENKNSELSRPTPSCHSNMIVYTDIQPTLFSMVDYCQPGWGEGQLFQDCTNVSSQDVHGQWPVWSPVSEVTYRNQHCAACHGQDPDILQPWDLTVFCEFEARLKPFSSVQEAVTNLRDVPTCGLGFNPPEESRPEKCDKLTDRSLRGVCPNDTSASNASSKYWFDRTCEAFFGEGPTGQQTLTLPSNLPCALCQMGHLGDTCEMDIDTPFPFMLVLSSRALVSVTSRARRSCRCAPEEMYDVYESRCRPIHCSPARRLQGSRCVPAVKRFKGMGYELNFRVVPVEVDLPDVIEDVASLQSAAEDMRNALQDVISGNWSDYLLFHVVFRAKTNDSSDVTAGLPAAFKEADVKIRMGVKYLVDVEEVEDKLLAVKSSRLNFTLSTSENIRTYEVLPLYPGENKAKLFYDEGDVQHVKLDVERILTNGTFSDYLVRVGKPEMYTYGTVDLTEVISEYHLVQYTLNCTKVSFNLTKHVQGEQLKNYSNPLMEKVKNRSEQVDRFAHSLNEHSGEIVLSLDRETGEVYHEPSGHTVGFQHVELRQEEDVVLVCVDQLYGPRRPLAPPALVLEKFFSTHMIYVSVAFQSLSVVCLFLVLLTYCLFAELRTLPGKNTMGMVTSLFLAMLLFEVGVAQVETPALCTLLGVLIHLALLSAFTWMVLCSLHMHRVFTHVLASRHLRQPEAQSSLFVKHVLISLLVPAVIVAGTLLGNWLAHRTDGGCGEGEESEGVDVGYGRGICFVSNPLSLLLASVVPVCVAVGVNVLLFLFTVRSLHHLGQDARQATQQQRQQLALYFRLSTLTGINWLVGPATTIIDSVIVWYIFIVLCGLQGLYVFIAFVCNRRVLSLYRTLFDCRKEAESESAPQLPGTGSTSTSPHEIDTRVKRKSSGD